MTANNTSFNPILTGQVPSTFTIQSDGLIQGVAMDDPAVRNFLAGGTLATTETLPMFGGVPIVENLPTSTTPNTGNIIARALTTATITGWSVLNQAHHAVTSTSSPAPMFAPGMSVHFYRNGSGARIPVPIDATLVSLLGGSVGQQVSWDFVNNKIIAYNATPGALAVKLLAIVPTNCKTIVYDSVNNYATYNNSGACALILI